MIATNIFFFKLCSSTIISASWQYSVFDKINFDFLWHHVKEIILQNFAGDVHVGVASPSVQNTIYLAQRDILKAIKEVSNECCMHDSLT